MSMKELDLQQQFELNKILVAQESERTNKTITATSADVKTIKDSETIAMTSVPGDSKEHIVIVNASANISGSSAGKDMTAAVHVNAPRAREVHVHAKPREYPLLEKLKAKQMIEWDIPALSNKFIGRETLIKKLDEQILEQDLKQSQEANTFVVNALKGLGGIGKSALALHYIRTAKQPYTLKAWFQAENIVALKQKYFELAKELGFVGEKEAEGVAYLKRWFKEQPGWLLVFDNVNSAEEIKDLLPEGRGKIILTSRYHHWTNIYKSIEVPVMEEKEAIDLVLSLIEEPKKANCTKEVHELSTLVKTLQTLPLALVQAGAYINANDISIREYVELYQKKESEAKLLQIPALGITERTVAITWNISLQEIVKTKDIALSIDLLCACGYLSPDNIPKELLSTWMQAAYKLDEIAFKQCLEGLKRYSMIQADATTFSIHRVAQTVIRHQQQGNIVLQVPSLIKFADLTTKWYSNLLVAAHSEFVRKTKVLEDEAREHQLLPHLQSLAEYCETLKFSENNVAFSTVLVDIGMVFHYRKGSPQVAKNYYERALIMQESHYGKNHIEVARILGNLGNACALLGDVKKQKEYLERALDITERHHGKDSINVAMSLGNLSNAYGGEGDAKKKKELLERALLIFEHKCGTDHMNVAMALSNLSKAYLTLGDAENAKTLLERALVIKKRHYSEDHVEIAKALGNLGVVYRDLGDQKRAKQLQEQALIINERYYGKDHVVVAMTLERLGNVYTDLKDAKKAKELLEQALVINESYYGKEHSQVATTLVNLSNAYEVLRDTKQQKELLERALVIVERYYGKDHVEIAMTLINLARANRSLNNLQEAFNLAQRCYAIFSRNYGEEHPNTIKANNFRQDCQKALSKHQDVQRSTAIQPSSNPVQVDTHSKKQENSEQPLIFSEIDNKKLEMASNNSQVVKPKRGKCKCVIL